MFASGKTCCVYSNDARPFAQRVLDVDATMGSARTRAVAVDEICRGRRTRRPTSLALTRRLGSRSIGLHRSPMTTTATTWRSLTWWPQLLPSPP